MSNCAWMKFKNILMYIYTYNMYMILIIHNNRCHKNWLTWFNANRSIILYKIHSNIYKCSALEKTMVLEAWTNSIIYLETLVTYFDISSNKSILTYDAYKANSKSMFFIHSWLSYKLYFQFQCFWFFFFLVRHHNKKSYSIAFCHRKDKNGWLNVYETAYLDFVEIYFTCHLV